MSNARDTLPTNPETPEATGRSGTRKAERSSSESQEMKAVAAAVEAERVKLHAEREELDASLAHIDDLLVDYLAGIDEDEEPTQVRRNVIALKRRMGVAPGSSRRR